MTELQQINVLIPVLPLRDVVVYPHMVIPLFVGREKSIDALDAAMKDNKQILLVAQKEAEVDEPDITDLYEVGTLANILQMLKLPDGTVKVLVEGIQRSKVLHYKETESYFSAVVTEIYDVLKLTEQEQDVLQRTVINSFEQYVKLNNKIPPEVLNSLSGIDDPSRLADTMAAHMALKVNEKQAILETADIEKRLEDLMTLMEGEVDLHVFHEGATRFAAQVRAEGEVEIPGEQIVVNRAAGHGVDFAAEILVTHLAGFLTREVICDRDNQRIRERFHTAGL